MRKPLSKQAGFRDSLVIRADYSTAPGMSGTCEIAVRWKKNQTEIWNWSDEWGSDCAAKLKAGADCADLVKAIVGNERIESAINPWEIAVQGDKPPLAKIVAMAWSTEFDSQLLAKLLALIPWQTLIQMEAGGALVDGHEMRKCLSEIAESVRKHDLSIEELELIPNTVEPTIAGVDSWLRRTIAKTVRRDRTLVRKLEAALKPFEYQMEQIISRWSADKPTRRYPGGGALPPLGKIQLSRYLHHYVLKNNKLPTGRHTIPEGIDIFSNKGKAFTVDFDALLR